MENHSKAYTFAVAALSAIGATLTTLVALTDHSRPEYIFEAAALAGVTAASVALTREIAKNKGSKYK